MRAFRLLMVLSVVATALLLAPSAFAESGSAEKPFVSGGRIVMNLSAGDYTIKAGRDDKIVVNWETNHDPDDNVKVTIRTDIAGKKANVTTDGPHDNLRIVIEVPATTDLHVDVSAGNVRLTGITGSKDIGSWAGNVDIDVPRPDDYRLMDLAVKAGNIRARGIGVKKDGLFRSFRRSGPGRYTLKVRLTAGNLTLIPA